MPRRDSWSEERRVEEREANRLRMAAKLLDQSYRDQVNARRKYQDRERKKIDPDLRPRLTKNSKRYFERRRGDPEFWTKRKEYFRRWKIERRVDEEFEDFMNRIEVENA